MATKRKVDDYEGIVYSFEEAVTRVISETGDAPELVRAVLLGVCNIAENLNDDTATDFPDSLKEMFPDIPEEVLNRIDSANLEYMGDLGLLDNFVEKLDDISIKN